MEDIPQSMGIMSSFVLVELVVFVLSPVMEGIKEIRIHEEHSSSLLQTQDSFKVDAGKGIYLAREQPGFDPQHYLWSLSRVTNKPKHC